MGMQVEMLITEGSETDSRKVEVDNPFDPYLFHAEMPLSGVYFPLGFPLLVTTNSAEILEAAQESWGACRQQFDIPPLRLHLGVLEGDSNALPSDPVSRAQGHLMSKIADKDNFYVADLMQGFTFGWFTRATVSRLNYFRFHFLDAAVLSHIANRHTTPIHAACVEWNGHGVLLCGDSGAGKSSLAFACARAGSTYVADDASFVLNGRNDRQVVGNCHMIRLRPSASELFDEVAGKAITPRVAGKPSIELSTSTIPGIRTATFCEIDYVVFLNRGKTNSQELTGFPKEVARHYMHKHLCGLEEFRRSQIASVERMLNAEVFELRYRGLEWAADRLERLVRERG